MGTPEFFHAVNDRSTLRQLISFMLDGEEAQKPQYILTEGIDASEQMLGEVLDTCPAGVRDNVIAAVSDYQVACEQAYMKLGMQTGFRLAVELLYISDKPSMPTSAWKAKATTAHTPAESQ